MSASATAGDVRFADVAFGGRSVRIEYAWLGHERGDRPLVVFLHEGLGSVSMWKAFPRALCDHGGLRGLVYSRPGYGKSTPRAPHERWGTDFMHRQADELLPRLFEAIGVDARDERPWLFGHSDGGSIALLYAARFPGVCAGVVAVAPHIFVERVSLESIEAARRAYLATDLRQRLARHHDDPDSAFHGWNDAWLDPAFRAWNIEEDVSRIECAVLAVQGCDDEYGTLEQVRGIARRLPATRLVEIPACGHSPHRDQPERLIEETLRFIAHNDARARPAGAGRGQRAAQDA